MRPRQPRRMRADEGLIDEETSATASREDALPVDPRLALAPREPVTSLRWFGKPDAPLLLSSSQGRFTLGTHACDLNVPRSLAAGVSALHAVLEREGPALRVIDQGSGHGTYPALGVTRMASFQVQAGQSFWLAGTRLLAMDTQLEVLRPRLAACLGLERHQAVDEAIELVASGRPVALVGPRGTDARRLAEAIHAASPQRGGAFVEAETSLPALDGLHGAAVFVDLDRVKRAPATWLRAAFDPARALRVVLACAHDRRVRHVLDHYRERIATIRLVPLAQRPDDVPALLARHWIDELRTTRRIEELGVGIAALAAYPWPGNLEELREHGRRLLAYLEYGGLRPAAMALGVKHQTLAEHFRRIGFEASAWGRDGTSTLRDGGVRVPVTAPWSTGGGWAPLWPVYTGEVRLAPAWQTGDPATWLPAIDWMARSARARRGRKRPRAIEAR